MKVISFLILLILAACGTHPDAPKDPMKSKDFQYKQCYQESESFKNTNVKGKGQVTIGFTLMPDGKIEDEKIISSPFKDANFHACLLQMTRELDLPKPKAPTNVTKIINFSSKTKIYEE